MYCPKCGQSQVADEVRFCSRCGFPLGGVTQLVAHDGAWPEYMPPSDGRLDSPKRKGLRQGGKILLVGAFLVPTLAILCIITGMDSELLLTGVLVVIAGIMRLLYALIFEDKHPAGAPRPTQFSQTAAPPQFIAAPRRAAAALPPQQSSPAPVSFRTRDTGELAGRPSVTENTTRLLDTQNDQREQ